MSKDMLTADRRVPVPIQDSIAGVGRELTMHVEDVSKYFSFSSDNKVLMSDMTQTDIS